MLFNDVAMIYLPTRVTFSSSIQPVSLPSSWELSNNFVGQWAVAAGYGRTNDQQLGFSTNTVISHVNLRVISEEECRASYGNNVVPSILCTSGMGGVGVCGGDSGGPLVVNRWGRPILGGLIISLINIAGNSVCGSSLISHNRLVTAAHCWFDGQRQAWQFVVVLGSQFLFSGGSRYATSTVIMHPQYTPSMLFNDVAVIYLMTSVTFTSAIQPVGLPNSWDLSDTFVGATAVAAGYGRTNDLQAGVSINTFVSEVNLRVISEAECRMTYPSNVIASTLCTSGVGGVGVCGGDSGGPLVVNRWGRPILIGISSFAAQIAGQSACQRGFPSGFARVTSFHSFIIQNM